MSVGITRSSSNCDSSELSCSSTSKQPTLQHTVITWQRWRTLRLCPGSQEMWTGPVPTHQHSSRAPQATKHSQCQQQSAGSCRQTALPCHGKPCAISQAAGPGGLQHVRGEERGWLWDWSDAGPCMACQTTGQACLGALTRVWAHLGQHWEPAGHRNCSGRTLCGSAQHSCLPTARSVVSVKH